MMYVVLEINLKLLYQNQTYYIEADKATFQGDYNKFDWKTKYAVVSSYSFLFF